MSPQAEEEEVTELSIPLSTIDQLHLEGHWTMLNNERVDEMKFILSRKANHNWISNMIYHLGRPVYESELVPLWTEVTRKEMPDREWLRRTKKVLTFYTGGAPSREWTEFKELVGFWGEDSDLEHSWEKERRASTSEIPSPPMNVIAEEEEPEVQEGDKGTA